MPRVLRQRQTLVPPAERAAYLITLRARRESARAQGCNFWVFEDRETGSFVEFIEARDDVTLVAAGDASLASSPILTEVEF